jgi:2-methylcitrate dehydratase PrpD
VRSLTAKGAKDAKESLLMSGPTASIASRICEVGAADLDDIAITAVKRVIADGVAVAIAGTREEPPSILARHAREAGGTAQATVWGFGFRTAPAQAAWVNAASMHVLDFEPMSNPPTHAVSPTVPAAFALAEARGAGGRDLVAACAKGFEMQGRVLLAADPARGSLPFHTPGIIGVMGSAVASAHLLRLGARQLVHALGMAASRASGLPANSGSMVKCTHCGNVAAAGLEAAMLAARGFTAHPGILDAPHGYVETFFESFDYDKLLQYGRPWRFVDPGMAIKFYPSKYPTHFAIAAALQARATVGDPARIRAVRIVTPEILDANRPSPRGGLEGKFSFQYTAAAALLDGEVGFRSFTDARRFRPDMVALLEKTGVVYDKSLSQDTRRMEVTVEVVLDDGRRHSATCRRAPGGWGAPIDEAQHRAKLRDCLETGLGREGAARALAALERLDKLKPAEVKQLAALLGKSKAKGESRKAKGKRRKAK